jgi:uncharacterized protein YaiI (UPF0178 family)
LFKIYVDADACPVKPEIYRVAKRCSLDVMLVANSWMRTPNTQNIQLQVVGAGADVADDWIVEHIQPYDIVVTTDIPLADHCIKKEARVISPTGKLFTKDNIGDSVATRNLLTELRSAGMETGGPPPITQRDRSFFLQQLDNVIQAVRRERPAGIA